MPLRLVWWLQGKGMTAKQKREAQADLAAGDIDIAIGTHALITEKTVFKSLGLAVIDEQHKCAAQPTLSAWQPCSAW